MHFTYKLSLPPSEILNSFFKEKKIKEIFKSEQQNSCIINILNILDFFNCAVMQISVGTHILIT